MPKPKKVQPSISKFFKSSNELGLSSNSQKKKGVERIDLTDALGEEIQDDNSEVVDVSKQDKPDNLNNTVHELPTGAELMSTEKFVEMPLVKKRRTENDTKTTIKRKKSSTLTPLEKQIIEFKNNNPDKLLAFQVGYKYKLYGEDAKIGSRILNIVLINDQKDERFSHCTFPDFKLHINLKRLLDYGYKIGVVKQAESAIVKSVEKSTSSNLMKRELTGVYTKGTYMGDEFIATNNGRISFGDEQNCDYIVCIHENSSKELSLVAVQPMTGQMVYDEFKDNLNNSELETRLLYLKPSEVIIINKNDKFSNEILRCIRVINKDATVLHKSAKKQVTITDELTSFFNDIDKSKYKHLVDYFSLNFSNCIQACINELIIYLSEFKLSNIFTIPSNITTFTNSKKYMILSSDTLQALEIFENSTDPNSDKGSLIWLLNHTRTRFGNRLLNKWISRPLVEREQIEERLQSIEDLTSKFNHVIDSLKNQLDKIGNNFDLEELLIKIHYSSTYNSGKISRKEIYLLLDCFNDIQKLIKSFDKSISELSNVVKSPLLLGILNELREAANTDLISRFLNMINASYILNESSDLDEQKIQFFDLSYYTWEDISKELEEIKQIESSLDDELDKVAAYLQRPQLQFVTNKNEPYLIEVRNNKVDSLPKDWERINGTTTVSRFRTPEISRLFKLLQYHKEMLIINCDKAFNAYLNMIDENYEYFNGIVKCLAKFDCLLSLTAASNINSNYVKPTITDEQIINISKSRNPIIENIFHDKNYVPNDIDISYNRNRVLIITGPNMGGKSSYVKQIALTVIMAQIGCYIPCESATMGLFDSIFIRMGASDNILKGESTFMTEMLECANIINNLSSKSLVILDEIGRGTGTNDGIAIAYSILKYLIEHPLKPLTLFITHYPSLHTLENTYKGTVANYHMGILEVPKSNQEFPDVIFLYNLVKGVVSNSYGLNVAKLAGLPSSIISNAFKISEDIKNKIEVQNIENFSIQFIKILKLSKENGHINFNDIENLFNFI